MMTEPIYVAKGIKKQFGNFMALGGVSLELAPGQILGLAGANGAGKSTMMRILAGALRPDDGELILDGRPIEMRSMQEAWSAGIAFVSQELNLFPTLTVAENLALVPGGADKISRSEREGRGRDILRRLGLHASLSDRLGSLSLAERQLVEIARALIQQPRVLILDEPTSALQAAEAKRLHGILDELRNSGTSIIYISHFIEELLGIADSIVVLRDGHRVPLAEPTVESVVAAMLGERSAPQQAAKTVRSPRSSGRKLTIVGLKGPICLDIPSLEISAGEVVGVAGLAGSGIEELFALLFGRIAPVSGKVGLPSGRAYRADTGSAVASGVAYVPADRKRLGLTLEQSVQDNVSSVRSLGLSRDGFVPSRHRQSQLAGAGCRATGVKLASIAQPVGSLSGGNQQKVVFAKWIEADPSLLLLDDPMRGVDIGAKHELHGLIRKLSDEGRVVLFYSSDAADYVAAADRVLVFAGGRIVRELPGDSLTEHQIIVAMNGGGSDQSAVTAA
jgi:ribose transport system ATP-binding protein